MKKYIVSLLLVVACFITASAQEFKEIPLLISTTQGRLADTVTNAAVKIVRTPATPGYWSAVGIGAKITKISGTVAGVVRLVGSYDGTNWFRVSPTDSLNAANVTTNIKSFTLTTYPYKYLGIQYTGTGTMAAKLEGYAVFKRSGH